MRITNKIMQNNNLANINTNKVYQDKLSTQMSTQKKINRPSDDPVVAIRALRLRSSVTEITQYYSKNIPDAESWLNVTEDGLKNLSQIITNMISQCTKGSNGDLTTSDREIILEQLKALGDEIYTTGDADYAGRYVFTGYRTDSSLRFQEDTKKEYNITEMIKSADIDSKTVVNGGAVLDINSNNFKDAGMRTVSETDIATNDVHRIRLSYDKCSEGKKPSISYLKPNANATAYTRETWSVGGVIKEMHDYENPHEAVLKDKNAVIFVPETGEILLGENRYNTLIAIKDDVKTTTDEGLISVTYQKEKWESNDLRPEHYFKCDSDGIYYNDDYSEKSLEKQAIEYDVGFNQTVRVNTTADQCFKHGIGRTVDELTIAMQEVLDYEKARKNISKMMETANTTDKPILEKQYDAVNKAYTYVKDKCQKLFEKGITAFQGYLDETNLAITDCGTRSSKLDLIKNRMQNQKTTFETLKSENEDIDITEVAIALRSAGLTYEAALMATGKVTQSTLLNYI